MHSRQCRNVTAVALNHTRNDYCAVKNSVSALARFEMAGYALLLPLHFKCHIFKIASSSSCCVDCPVILWLIPTSVSFTCSHAWDKDPEACRLECLPHHKHSAQERHSLHLPQLDSKGCFLKIFLESKVAAVPWWVLETHHIDACALSASRLWPFPGQDGFFSDRLRLDLWAEHRQE